MQQSFYFGTISQLWILGAPDSDSAGLHCLPICNLVQFKVLIVICKALHGLTPAYLQDHLPKTELAQSIRFCSGKLLIVPHFCEVRWLEGRYLLVQDSFQERKWFYFIACCLFSTGGEQLPLFMGSLQRDKEGGNFQKGCLHENPWGQRHSIFIFVYLDSYHKSVEGGLWFTDRLQLDVNNCVRRMAQVGIESGLEQNLK